MGSQYASRTLSRPTALAAVLLGTAFAAGPGGIAGEAPAAREVAAQIQTASPLPCITPREAREDFIRVAVAGGKGAMALPVKGGQVNVLVARGALAVEVPGDGTGRPSPAVALPERGFSVPLVVNLEYPDKSTGIAALSFAHGSKEGELFVRNMAVATARAGDGLILIADDNCNGKYGDSGEDAVTFDNSRLAVPLGSTLVVGGVPCGVQVAENGRKVTITPTDARLGMAGLNTRDGWTLMAGAVVKGPGGSFALRPDRHVAVPAGSYELAYAVIEDAGGRRAMVGGGNLKMTVPEGGQAALPSLGTVKLDVQARFDPASGKITVEPPKPEAVTCAGGRVTYFFPLPAPDVNVKQKVGNQEQTVRANMKMPIKGGAMVFLPGDAGMRYFEKYKLEMVWMTGVGPEARGSVQLEITLPTPPNKKK